MAEYLKKCQFESADEETPPEVTIEQMKVLEDEIKHLKKTLRICIEAVYSKEDFDENQVN